MMMTSMPKKKTPTSGLELLDQQITRTSPTFSTLQNTKPSTATPTTPTPVASSITSSASPAPINPVSNLNKSPTTAPPPSSFSNTTPKPQINPTISSSHRSSGVINFGLSNTNLKAPGSRSVADALQGKEIPKHQVGFPASAPKVNESSSSEEERPGFEYSGYRSDFLDNYSATKGLSESEEGIYQDLLKSHKDSWGDKQKALQHNAAKMQRQNSELNARLGSSVGGGFAGGMAQAALAANQEMLGERNKHDAATRELMMSHLDKSISARQRGEDNELKAGLAGEDMGFRSHQAGQEAALGLYRDQEGRLHDAAMQAGRQAHDTNITSMTNEANNPVSDPMQQQKEKFSSMGAKWGVSPDKSNQAMEAYLKKHNRYPANTEEFKQALKEAYIPFSGDGRGSAIQKEKDMARFTF